MSRRQRARARKLRTEGRQIDTDAAGRDLNILYNADVLVQCGRCRALLWHAHAPLLPSLQQRQQLGSDPVSPSELTFQPYLVEPNNDFNDGDDEPYIGRLTHLWGPMIPIEDWAEMDGEETQQCQGCARRVSISRRRIYARLRDLWGDGLGTPRRQYVEA